MGTYPRLLSPQSFYRVHCRSPPCGQITGEHGRRGQDDWNRGEGQRIYRADSKQERLHQAGQPDRRSKSNGHPHTRQRQRVSHEHSPQFALLRPKREPDTDFAPALRHSVGNHTIDADDPNTSAIAPAIPNITSVKDVRASD